MSDAIRAMIDWLAGFWPRPDHQCCGGMKGPRSYVPWDACVRCHVRAKAKEAGDE